MNSHQHNPARRFEALFLRTLVGAIALMIIAAGCGGGGSASQTSIAARP